MKQLNHNKKGDFELDEIGKLILGLILLVILIIIVAIVLKGELFHSIDRIKSIFGFFK